MDPSTLRGDDPEDRSPFHGEQPAPHGPLFALLRRFFTGGNALVRTGIVIFRCSCRRLRRADPYLAQARCLARRRD